MNTNSKRTVGILTVLSFLATASAFYNAEVGRWLSRDPIGADHAFTLQQNEGSLIFETLDSESIEEPQRDIANIYTFVGNDPLGKWDALGLLTATGGRATTSPIRHNNYLTFVITCPRCTEFVLNKIDYSGVTTGLLKLGYTPAELAAIGDLGGTRSVKTPNCSAVPVTVEAFMRSRLSFYGKAGAVAAYVAGTIIDYDCKACGPRQGCCNPVLVP